MLSPDIFIYLIVALVVGVGGGYLLSRRIKRPADPRVKARLERIDSRIIRLQGEIFLHDERQPFDGELRIDGDREDA